MRWWRSTSLIIVHLARSYPCLIKYPVYASHYFPILSSFLLSSLLPCLLFGDQLHGRKSKRRMFQSEDVPRFGGGWRDVSQLLIAKHFICDEKLPALQVDDFC